MINIHVGTGRSYDILIGHDILDSAGEYIRRRCRRVWHSGFYKSKLPRASVANSAIAEHFFSKFP